MAGNCTLLLFYSVLVRLSAEDLQKRKISDRYFREILILAIFSLFTLPEISLVSRVLGMFSVSVPMAALALCFSGSFGGGDVKFLFAAGAFLGWQLVTKGAVLAIGFAGIYSLWLILGKRHELCSRFSFGPFLSAGFLLVSVELFYIP